MVLDFLFNKKKKEQAANPSEQKKKESIEERIEREMQALPAFIKNKIKDPSIKDKFITLAKRMEKDGVDMNSPKQMKKWVKENEKQLKEEQQNGKVETIVKDDEPGRNDPCTCGSGQKYKKCCGK